MTPTVEIVSATPRVTADSGLLGFVIVTHFGQRYQAKCWTHPTRMTLKIGTTRLAQHASISAPVAAALTQGIEQLAASYTREQPHND